LLVDVVVAAVVEVVVAAVVEVVVVAVVEVTDASVVGGVAVVVVVSSGLRDPLESPPAQGCGSEVPKPP
jgi:hypothetical protein